MALVPQSVYYNYASNVTFNMTNNSTNLDVTGNGTEWDVTVGGTPFGWYNVVIGVAMYTAVLVTICGNTLVLIAVVRNKRLQTVFNFYVINLAVTDLLVAVTAMSFYTTDTMLGYWPFGEFLCGVWIFVDYGMTFASVFTLMAISIDRFWSVTWGFHYRAHHNKRKAVLIIAAVWLFMLVLWLPACIMDRLHNSVPNRCVWEPSRNKEYVIVVATLGHHGAFTVMVVCYIKVLYTLVRRKKVGLGHARMSEQSPILGTRPTIVFKPTDQGDQTHEEGHVLPDTSSDALQDTNSNKYDASRDPKPESSLQTKEGELQCENGTNLYGVHLVPMCSQAANSVSNTEDCSTKYIHISTDDSSRAAFKKQSSFLIRRSRKRKDRRKEEAKHDRHERRVFTTLTYILAGYIICWFPFHVVFDVRAAKPEVVTSIVYNLTFWLSYLNSMINPFLYNFSSSEFRTAFKQLLCTQKPVLGHRL